MKINRDGPLIPDGVYEKVRLLRSIGSPLGSRARKILGELGVRYLIAEPDYLPKVKAEVRQNAAIFVNPSFRGMCSLEPRINGEILKCRRSPGYWSLRVRVRRETRLLVSETNVRGWRVLLKPGPRRLALTRGPFISTILDPGEYEVRMRYDPLLAKFGMLCSVVSCVALITLACLARRDTAPIANACANSQWI